MFVVSSGVAMGMSVVSRFVPGRRLSGDLGLLTSAEASLVLGARGGVGRTGMAPIFGSELNSD
jgi:hypothetical protein